VTEKPAILIADDDRAARGLPETWLRSAEMRVERAENGREALEKAARLRPDIILPSPSPLLFVPEGRQSAASDFSHSKGPPLASD